MKRTLPAVLVKWLQSVASEKFHRHKIFYALLLSACCNTAFAAPDAGITNGGTVYFEGNQSLGVLLQVGADSPASLVVSNLTSPITPFPFAAGVQIGGSDSTRILTATVATNVVISTFGHGIFAENGGGFLGSYEIVTNSFSYTTNVVNGTNVITVTTNLVSGATNNYATFAPSGGVTVNNGARITTIGDNAHGIFAESIPGNITLTLLGSPVVNQGYGNGGPVTVFDTGNITTSGSNSHGIFAQSLGGIGPENSYSAGAGFDVSVQTAGASITNFGNGAFGIFAQSRGGDNVGGESGGAGGDGRTGGLGGDSGKIIITGTGNLTSYGDNGGGIFALSQAGNGGNGGNGGTLGGSGGNGGSGGKGSDVTINGGWNIETYGTNANGITAQSLGGRGGSGGDGSHFIDLGGGNGGGTGDGGKISVTSAGNIHTRGFSSLGIFARSLGGFAGNGGNSYNAFYGNAGDGNSAGAGQDVAVMNSGNITTEGNLSQAIYAESVGGGGGSAGSSGALVSLGSGGGAGGNAGKVGVTNSGALLTFGSGSHGIEAQSLGGGGGDGGNAGGLVALGGSGSIASTGSVVTVFNTGAITTFGSNSYAILAQSIGGGGGNAGSAAGAASLGASGGGGGDGGAVHVFNSGQFQNTGEGSYGLFAQSIGGGGGNGGGGNGLVSVGGEGGTASKGDVVTVVNSGSILSSENAIFAQSIGGGGGNGGSGNGWFAVGGTGGGGGNGSAVTVDNSGNLRTLAANASALFAQSVGGGGGNGGNSVAAGAFGSLAIGGAGGNGGDGDRVTVNSGTNTITTLGNNSYGIDAQSVGGGGGNGGYAVAASVGKGFSAAVALGGKGGGGGDGSNVTVYSQSTIATYGTNSHGLFAQSIGGGGGAGGFSVAVSGSDTAALSLAMGGDGGSGGNGGIVDVTSTGNIITTNEHAYGIIAQSVGGGGGDGGFSVAAAFAGSGGVAASVSFGGTGGDGGISDSVNLFNSGTIYTFGNDSHAIMAQSVGGGGGSGGFSVTGDVGGGAVGASFGGSGGGAGAADTVSLVNYGMLTTFGDRSDGILAQSVGGGGGNGGFSVAGNIGKSASLGLAMGGNGGTGGSAASVTVTNFGLITTHGDESRGIFAQSLGGGGGDGGFAVAGSITSGNGVSAALALGGNGTTGGIASAVIVMNSGAIETFGTNAVGLLAQSVGGGGGSGGFAGAGALGFGTNSIQLSASIGGHGGEGNHGGIVTVDNEAQILTHGDNAIGLFAQSLGGGGGNGGMSFAGSFSTGNGNTSQAALAIGGDGGTGGDASTVRVNNTQIIATGGDNAYGILAQSIGGGGGNGGLAAAIDFSLGATGRVTQFAVSIGGSGGAGGKGGNVFVTGTNSSGVLSNSAIYTTGQNSYGIFAQSVGGGGGSGGFSLAATGVLGAKSGTNRAITFAIGGKGGSGNDGGAVFLDRSGTIETFGDGSYGILAQSIGGGGGDGGSASSFSLFTRGSRGKGKSEGSTSKSLNISVGGDGQGGGSGGSVTLTNFGDITTHGADAYGILAQSVGGGGGSGGNAHSSTDDLVPIPIPGLDNLINKIISTKSETYEVVVGGSGGASGAGSQVIVNDVGNITTLGDGSYALFAQSVGGGGGVAGNGGIGTDGKLGIGGSGGSSGDGGAVDVIYTGNIFTAGAGSAGIFAQSVGGGGGVAGNMDRGLKDFGLNIGKGFAFGGDGGSAGNGSQVNVNSSGNITTAGNGAYGIFAQSVGGGGGLLGNLGNDLPVLSTLTDFAGSIGHSGSGGNVVVSHSGQIQTFGTNSTAIFAQSAGGTNGVGGNVSVTLNGSIYANGFDADGIYAQSGGGATVVTPPIPPAPTLAAANPVNGDIVVTISSNSFVQGGTGNAVGVRIMDGVNNTLENHGNIMTVASLSGTAVAGTGGNDTINNYGALVGSVDLGGGANRLNNFSNAILFAGDHINLGAGNILANSGIISLGDVSHLQVTALTGNFQQSSNGVLLVKLASPTSYDALHVNGSVSLGGNLSVSRFDNYLPTKGTAFTIVTGTNVSGEFSSFFDPYKNNYALRLEQVQTSTNFYLQVIQDSFLKFTFTGNQKNVADNLNSFSGLGTTNGDPRGAALIAYLNTRTADQLPGDFDLIAPDEFGALFDLDFATIGLASGNLRQRMSEIRSGNHESSGSVSLFDSRGKVIQLASNSRSLPAMHDENSDNDWSLFAAGNGQYVEVQGSTNASSYHFDSEGATVGADKMLNPHTAIGVTLDYAKTRASLVNGGQVDVDGGRLGLYGTWFDHNSYVEGSVGAGFNRYATERPTIGGTATGVARGYDLDALLGGGIDMKCGNWTFGPQASLHYTFVQVNEFTEKGSLSPLHLEDNDSESLLSRLGAHLGYDWDYHGVIVHPELQLAWQREWLDNNRAIESRFASGAGNIFTVDSASFGRDSLSLDFGVTVRWSRTVSSFLAYHGDFLRDNYDAHSASVGLSVSF